jgi:hypothetical protein
MTVWNTDIIGLEIMFLALQSVLYPCLTVYFDVLSTRPSFWRQFRKPRLLSGNDHEEIDEDVAAENERIANGSSTIDDIIVINKLTKYYPNGTLAVNKVSLGIPLGQCFGLLGIYIYTFHFLSFCIYSHFIKIYTFVFHMKVSTGPGRQRCLEC